MHPYDIMLIISIATAVAFTALLYVRHDLVLAFGSIFCAVVGSFAGAFLALAWVPVHEQFAIIYGAVGGSSLMVGVLWLARRRSDR